MFWYFSVPNRSGAFFPQYIFLYQVQKDCIFAKPQNNTVGNNPIHIAANDEIEKQGTNNVFQTMSLISPPLYDRTGIYRISAYSISMSVNTYQPGCQLATCLLFTPPLSRNVVGGAPGRQLPARLYGIITSPRG